jgi:hypothetical protein
MNIARVQITAQDIPLFISTHRGRDPGAHGTSQLDRSQADTRTGAGYEQVAILEIYHLGFQSSVGRQRIGKQRRGNLPFCAGIEQ